MSTLKSLQRDLKKANVELEQILKKDSHIKNEKKKAQEIRKKQWKERWKWHQG